MVKQTLSASVRQFANMTKLQMRNVFAESVQDVVDAAQLPRAKGGRIPVDTGNLRNSLASGLNGTMGAPDASSYVVTLSQMEIGDIAQFAWTAPYARRIELGFSGKDSLGRTYEQAGTHFLSSAVAQWPQFVTANAARLKK
ncbi:HK97 gp10 family phage protein [Agrobacterium sp. BT-220-3]|nr:HK97 gp10 family phage protein [Agrobacterium sp. BT-220-3]